MESTTSIAIDDECERIQHRIDYLSGRYMRHFESDNDDDRDNIEFDPNDSGIDDDQAVASTSKSPPPYINLIPDKYQQIDIQDLCPSFSKKNAKFLQLFGTTKSMHAPKPYEIAKSNRAQNYFERNKELFDEIELENDIAVRHERVLSSFFTQCEDSDDEENAGEIIPPSCAWRIGPGRMWYDLYQVPLDADEEDLKNHFNMLAHKIGIDKIDSNVNTSKLELFGDPNDIGEENDDQDILQSASQSYEEFKQDVVTSYDDIKKKALKLFHSANDGSSLVSWIPTFYTRTFAAYQQCQKEGKFEEILNRYKELGGTQQLDAYLSQFARHKQVPDPLLRPAPRTVEVLHRQNQGLKLKLF